VNDEKLRRKKEKLAAPARYYGGTGTIHETQELDVEVHNGRVVAVWFRCQALPFRQAVVDAHRAATIQGGPLPRLTGVEVLDDIPR
jgi:hypothetical protein